MENNTTNTVALDDVINAADVRAGDTVTRTVDGKTEVYLWTGAITKTYYGSRQAVLIDADTGEGATFQLDTKSDWRVYSEASTALNGKSTRALVTRYGLKTLAAQNYSDQLDTATRRLNAFKAEARDQLVEWFDNNLDESQYGDSFDDLLEDIGLERRTRTYSVRVRVSYEVEVEVEATSAEAAQEQVEDDSYSVTDQVDTSYYEDYEVIQVEEA